MLTGQQAPPRGSAPATIKGVHWEEDDLPRLLPRLGALLFATLQTGSTIIQDNTSVNPNVVSIIEALLFLFVTVQIGFDWHRRHRKRAANTPRAADREAGG